MLRSPPSSNQTNGDSLTADNKNKNKTKDNKQQKNGNHDSHSEELIEDNSVGDNTSKRIRGRPRKNSDTTMETEIINQVRELFLENKEKAIARKLGIREDIDETRNDISNLIQLKFNEHMRDMNERIELVSETLGDGIENNAREIALMNERHNNVESRVEEATATTKSVLNIENEFADRLDRQSN